MTTTIHKSFDSEYVIKNALKRIALDFPRHDNTARQLLMSLVNIFKVPLKGINSLNTYSFRPVKYIEHSVHAILLIAVIVLMYLWFVSALSTDTVEIYLIVVLVGAYIFQSIITELEFIRIERKLGDQFYSIATVVKESNKYFNFDTNSSHDGNHFALEKMAAGSASIKQNKYIAADFCIRWSIRFASLIVSFSEVSEKDNKSMKKTISDSERYSGIWHEITPAMGSKFDQVKYAATRWIEAVGIVYANSRLCLYLDRLLNRKGLCPCNCGDSKCNCKK